MTLSLLLCGLSLLSLAGSAQAQRSASEKAAAEALFDEGLQLLRQEKLNEACKRFEKSQNIDPAVGTLLYLAECYERTGRTASAWATFREAASGASASGQNDRAAVGSQRAKLLEPKLSRVVLEVGRNAQLQGFELRSDGAQLAAAVFGEPVPMDPGEHQLRASAPGYETWTQSLTVSAESGVQTVTVPALTPLPATSAQPAAPPAVSGPTRSTTEPMQDTPPKTLHQPDYTWAWVSGGVGVAGVAVGVAFGLRAADQDADAADSCSGTRCADQAGVDANKDARSSALIANIGYGVGVLGLGTAVVLTLLEMGHEETAQAPDSKQVARGSFTWHLQPELSHEATGVHLLGKF